MANITQIKDEPSDWNITLSSNGIPISYKTDTGAHCNFIPVESLQNISPKPDLQPVNVKLSPYNGSRIPVVGKFSLTLDHKNNCFSFIVADLDFVQFLGLKTSEHLQLIKRTCQIERNSEKFFPEFHDCFGEKGTLNITHHIEVKDNVKPVATSVHKVPHILITN